MITRLGCAPPSPADCQTFDPADVFAAGEQNHHISNTAYPIAHRETFWPYRIAREAHRATVESAFEGIDELCLYSHIPFCETRCFFCEYTVVGRRELDATEEYMAALDRELLLYRELLGPRRLYGLDIGGGTPSFPAADLIARHLQNVTDNFAISADFSVSIETTPKIASLEPDKIRAYKAMGIDRISMGVQVTQPDLLKTLGREENGLEHHYRATENIRRAGFTKFNIDLMYGFADQSAESWAATLAHAIALEPEYITLYRMRYKLTRISHQAERVTLTHAREHARVAKEKLAAAGYRANPGKNTYTRVANDTNCHGGQGSARDTTSHPAPTGTSAYLTRRVIQGMPYLGLGLGAQSFTHSTISYNSGAVGKNLSPYLRDIEKGILPIQDLYHLSSAHMMAKMIAVSFYFGEINLSAFREKFAIDLESAYPAAVDYLLQQGLMHYTESENGAELEGRDKRSLSLTELGAKHFNGSIALFFAPSVQDYLIRRNLPEHNNAPL